MTGPTDDGFLNRWSARKRSVASAEEAPDHEATDELNDAGDLVEADSEKSDEELIAELDLPDPDTLIKGDDFSKFMSSAVPARLRNRALRRLWISDPVLANLDELLDYGDDFTDAATVIENMQTAYDAVRGMMPEEVEPDPDADDAIAETDTDDEDEAASLTESDDQDESAEPETGDDAHASDTDLAEAEPIGGEPSQLSANGAIDVQSAGKQASRVSIDPLPPRVQRMRFRFDNG